MIDKGTLITNKPFMSCDAAQGAGKQNKPVILNIFAPKGIKGIYAEPWARFGKGSKRKWDGVSRQTDFGKELEVILQRGAKVRPLKVVERNGKLIVDVEVVSQMQD